jgi:cellulose synthase/poly-beta-1,6-N-acetylglucosamine synthase-like glycosyltransferase
VAIEVGGYDTSTVGEDMELVLKMHRHMLEKKEPYAVRYVPEPVCWTEAPEDLRFLSNQRTRWQRGALECLSRHRKMIFNPRYGRLGMVTLPLFILIDLLGPIAEILGYCLCLILLLVGWLSLPYFLATTGLIFAFGVFISLMALVVEQDEIERLKSGKDIASILLMACVENLGYRQLCSYWRIKGLYQYFRGMNHVWGRMERRGFNAKS